MRNEIYRGRRYTQEELRNSYKCCDCNIFDELLVYNEKIGRDLSFIYAHVIKELIANAQYRDEIANLKQIWDEAIRYFNN